MEKQKQSTLTPWEKLLLLLGPEPDEIASMPIAEVEEKLRVAGVDPEPVVVSVENMVCEALAEWGRGTKGDGLSQEVTHSAEDQEQSNVLIPSGDDVSLLRSPEPLATAVAAQTMPYAFDDRHIRWRQLGEFEHFVLAMLDVDVSRKLCDFIIKFAPNQRIFLHRHLALTNTFVVQGEHRLYEPSGPLKEVRRVGSYTSSPPADPHREGAGAEGGVVFYSVRGKDGTLFEFLDDDLHVVATLSMEDYVNAFKAQRKG
jgi:2,4'-dihydroxyacetophenone dioxygenase